jgi:hypothetical protein
MIDHFDSAPIGTMTYETVHLEKIENPFDRMIGILDNCNKTIDELITYFLKREIMQEEAKEALLKIEI